MKKEILFTVSSSLVFLISYLLMNSIVFAHNNEHGLSHDLLAHRYANLAKVMENKIHEELAILKVLNNKPHFSFFENNGRNIKNYVSSKIERCEKAAIEYSDKAAYHHALAIEQKISESVVNKHQITN
ncbi:MAG: hypothetical protein H6937_02080 [Burkholderiales bacterium]|nr:hypothetical protein [Burkholderiales bacterium]MDR4517944.1 hypothetical protein [Nitrosomonas sp.]